MIREWLLRLLRIKPEELCGDTWNNLIDKQDRERIKYQKWCKHEEETSRYYPIIICKHCTKPLRWIEPEGCLGCDEVAEEFNPPNELPLEPMYTDKVH
ncbi:hypothetical protein LCGC14_1341360 [marine sediment metagenome]|uniref:Uncharacterized protein n=1 Tax=marine sediment metagenome TaxID=412755 RepID=A0A0F9MUJ8_9ZZZZ